MPGNYRKDDLRVLKTQRAFFNSLHSLLLRRNFNRITVNDLCDEAFVSRAAFYNNFNDKYDLLNYCLNVVKINFFSNIDTSQTIDELISSKINSNNKIIKHLTDGANEEVLELADNFILSIFNEFVGKELADKNSPNYAVLSNFCTGGISKLILMQVNSKTLQEKNLISTYLIDIIKNIVNIYN